MTKDIIIYPSHSEIESIYFWTPDETTVGLPTTDEGDE